MWCWDLTGCIVPHLTIINVAVLVLSISSLHSVTMTGSLSLSESVSPVSPVMPQFCDVLSVVIDWLLGEWWHTHLASHWLGGKEGGKLVSNNTCGKSHFQRYPRVNHNIVWYNGVITAHVGIICGILLLKSDRFSIKDVYANYERYVRVPADGDIAWRSFSIIGMSMSWFAKVSRVSPDFLRESNIVATNQCWVLGYSCYLDVASWWEYHYEIKPSDIQCMSLVVIKGNSLCLYQW